MLSPELIDPFLGLLRKRASDLYLPDGVSFDEDDDFADWLNHQCGWDYKQALAIAQGEEDAFDWDEEEIFLVCDSLNMEVDLVELLFQPISQEGLVYAAQEHYKNTGADNPVLMEMVHTIEKAESLSDTYTAILSYIDQVVIDHNIYDLHDEDDVLMAKQLLPAFFALKKSAQYRVLGIVHEELEEVDRTINPLPIFLGLRAIFSGERRHLIDSAFSHEQAVELLDDEIVLVRNYLNGLAECNIESPFFCDSKAIELQTDYVPFWFDSFHGN